MAVLRDAGKKMAMITLTDLAASEVPAIRTFFHFVATKVPGSIAQRVEILNIPIKRAPVSKPSYLDPAEVTAIVGQPDRTTVGIMRCSRSSTIATHE